MTMTSSPDSTPPPTSRRHASSSLVSFLASASVVQKVILANVAAGAIEKTIVYPLDVIKTRFQLQTPRSPSSHVPYRGVTHGLWSIVKQEGFRRLFRGFAFPVIGFVPNMGVRLTTNELLKNSWFSSGFAHGSPIVRYFTIGVAGAIAGAVETLVIAPVDMVKIRLQKDRIFKPSFVQKLSESARLELEALRNQTETILSILRNRSLGFTATLLRQTTYGATTFLSYEALKTYLVRDNENIKGFYKLIAGVSSGILAAIVGSPLDVIKTRIQSNDPSYGSLSAAFRKTLSEEGFRGFFKGLSIKMFRIAVGTGICLVAFEEILRLLIEPSLPEAISFSSLE